MQHVEMRHRGALFTRPSSARADVFDLSPYGLTSLRLNVLPVPS